MSWDEPLGARVRACLKLSIDEVWLLLSPELSDPVLHGCHSTADDHICHARISVWEKPWSPHRSVSPEPGAWYPEPETHHWHQFGLAFMTSIDCLRHFYFAQLLTQRCLLIRRNIFILAHCI